MSIFSASTTKFPGFTIENKNSPLESVYLTISGKKGIFIVTLAPGTGVVLSRPRTFTFTSPFRLSDSFILIVIVFSSPLESIDPLLRTLVE